MARKAVESGGTRDEIISVAKRLFFEQGFDGVTIRNIQREVGCEVGLFYYYFKSKDQVFDVVMDRLQHEWDNELSEAVESADGNYKEQLLSVVDCMHGLMVKYIGGAGVLHWSVKGALCDRMATVVSAYIKELLVKTGVSIRVSEENLGIILAGGIGKILLEGIDLRYERIKDDIVRLLDAVLPEYRGRSKELSVELL